MAKRMNRGLVALSSAAILSVYGIGYALSQPAAVTMAAGSGGATTSGSTPAASTAASGAVTPASGSTSVSSPVSAAATGATAQSAGTTLKDGTYTGSGSSRHGGVNVSVTIQNGRITTANITSVTTRYSVNVISGLPAKVVSAQSAKINLVSGATDSSSAYVQAVQQAL